MKTTASPPDDRDEVERCRQVRRALERSHGDLDGLCRWLESFQRPPSESVREEKLAAPYPGDLEHRALISK